MEDITVRIQTYYGEEYVHTYHVKSFDELVKMLNAKGSAVVDVLVR